MPTTTPLTDAINALTTYANETTGASDTDLSSAVATLVAGYGGGGTDYAPDLLMDKLTEYSSNEVTSLRRSAFRYATKIVTLNLPECLSVATECITYMSALEHLYLPKCKTFSSIDAISYNSKLSVLALPSITSAINSYGFRSNGFTALDLGESFGGFITGNCLNGCTKLNTLIIRNPSVASLPNINVFTNTPFASGKAGGTLYVPNSLISGYQSATNWSTILGYANNSIKSIESTHTDPDAPIDLTLYYADGTPIE